MMEALKLFVLLSSQKAVVAWQSCILMSSEIHHTQRCNREIKMNKPKRAYRPRTTFPLNVEFVKAVKRAALSERQRVRGCFHSVQAKNLFFPHWLSMMGHSNQTWVILQNLQHNGARLIVAIPVWLSQERFASLIISTLAVSLDIYIFFLVWFTFSLYVFLFYLLINNLPCFQCVK